MISPDMAPVSGKPVQLEGARGPLSVQQSKAILTQLESRGQETNIFDRHLAIEEGVTDSPLVVGNRVTLLQDGPTTYQAMYKAIAGREKLAGRTVLLVDTSGSMDAPLARRSQMLRMDAACGLAVLLRDPDAKLAESDERRVGNPLLHVAA